MSEHAVAHFVERSRRYSEVEEFKNAEGQPTRGLPVVPNSNMLCDELEILEDMRRAPALFADALVESRPGRNEKAPGSLERWLGYDPNYSNALHLFEWLTSLTPSARTIEPIRLQTGAPVSINFKNAPFKKASPALGRACGVNMILDTDMDDRPITVFAENADFAQAFQILLKSNRAF